MEMKFLSASTTLIGATIGAGVLGIPYVVAQAGVVLGLVSILVIGLAIILINLYLGEVVLRTRGKHQLTGYARLYLGSNGARLMALATMVSIYGAIIAYTIGVGAALSSIFNGSALTFSLIFFVVGAVAIYIGLKVIEKSEFILTSLIIVILIMIALVSFFSPHFIASNLTYFNFSNALVPYGVVLFAFLGIYAIPEMNEELGRRRKLLKKAIIFGGIVPIAAYALFALAVVGVTGTDTSQIATIRFGQVFGQQVLVAANLFATFAMATSFLVLGLALKEMYQYDYKLDKRLSWLLTCSVPLIAILLGLNQFIPILAVVGALAGGSQGIMIVLMHMRSKKLGQRKPEFSIRNSKVLGILLILLFVGGIVYELLT